MPNQTKTPPTLTELRLLLKDAEAQQYGRRLARLRNRIKQAGITQLQIAEAAGVKPPHVCNVLAGRDTSGKILAAAQRLIDQKEDGDAVHA